MTFEIFLKPEVSGFEVLVKLISTDLIEIEILGKYNFLVILVAQKKILPESPRFLRAYL